jgi:hypothetical protein
VSTASEGGKVITTLPVRASEDVIVLLDPDLRPSGVEKWHPFPNILRVRSSGDVVWRSELLPGDTWKCYLAMEWDDEELLARTASYSVHLDPASGKVTDSTFTK